VLSTAKSGGEHECQFSPPPKTTAAPLSILVSTSTAHGVAEDCGNHGHVSTVKTPSSVSQPNPGKAFSTIAHQTTKGSAPDRVDDNGPCASSRSIVRSIIRSRKYVVSSTPLDDNTIDLTATGDD
jgi:hypothetical protein